MLRSHFIFQLLSLLVLSLACSSVAGFSPTSTRAQMHRSKSSSRRSAYSQKIQSLRGGEQLQESTTSDLDQTSVGSEMKQAKAVRLGLVPPLFLNAVSSFGKFYAKKLEQRPILVKSVTAAFIFALSDYLAQRLEGGDQSSSDVSTKVNWTRTITSLAVGLFYFGPAAHYWYETIFRVLPGTSLLSTLYKAAAGQLLFGPSFTCIFFATSLLQAGTFSLGNWARKIRADLPGAWLAGISFWPIVDLVSYSLIPPKWIPLFVNMCSLVWTIYLSTVANRNTSA